MHWLFFSLSLYFTFFFICDCRFKFYTHIFILLYASLSIHPLLVVVIVSFFSNLLLFSIFVIHTHYTHIYVIFDWCICLCFLFYIFLQIHSLLNVWNYLCYHSASNYSHTGSNSFSDIRLHHLVLEFCKWSIRYCYCVADILIYSFFEFFFSIRFPEIMNRI